MSIPIRKLFQNFLFLSSIFMLLALISCEPKEGKTITIEIPIIEKKIDTLNVTNVVDSLSIMLETLKIDTALKHASLAYIIYSTLQDSILYAHNEWISLVPASTLKLLTSAAALEILGSQNRFKTSLSYVGDIKDGVLNGHLVILGGGDPALGSEVFNQANFMAAWVKAIKDLDIDSISGHVVADGRIFRPESIPYTWAWGEMGASYAAGASGLSIHDNLFKLNLTPKDTPFVVTNPKNLIPYIPTEVFKNATRKAVIDKDNLIVTFQPPRSIRFIQGVFSQDKNDIIIKTPILDPAYTTAHLFYNLLLKEDIKVAGIPLNIIDYDTLKIDKKELKQITVVYSPTIASIVNNVNTFSNNMFTEHLLKHIGLKKYGSGDTDSGCKGIIDFLKSKGINTQGMFLFDGSGLSRFNAISVRHLYDVLAYMKNAPEFENFYNSMAKAGSTGTLRNLCVGSVAEDQITAKSGTMSRVKSYAGYAHTTANDTLIFAFIANNYICTSKQMTEKFEQIMIQMVK